jgi:hypothetical protein
MLLIDGEYREGPDAVNAAAAKAIASAQFKAVTPQEWTGGYLCRALPCADGTISRRVRFQRVS